MANIFDDVEQNQQEQEEAYEEILEDEGYPSQAGDSRLSAAMRTLEKAKLYETLINHSVFAPNSARPDIQLEVEEELRAFVDERLNVLLGVKSASVQQQVVSQFTEEESRALKQLAARVIQRAAEPTPAVVTAPSSSGPQVSQVPAPQQPLVNQVRSSRPATPAPKKRPRTAEPEKKPADDNAPDPRRVNIRRKPTANVGEFSGKDLSQAGNRKALPMPTAQQLEQIMMMRVKDPVNASDGSAGNPLGNNLMTTAISLALK